MGVSFFEKKSRTGLRNKKKSRMDHKKKTKPPEPGILKQTKRVVKNIYMLRYIFTVCIGIMLVVSNTASVCTRGKRKCGGIFITPILADILCVKTAFGPFFTSKYSKFSFSLLRLLFSDLVMLNL